MLARNAKAWVAAGVTLAASLVAAKFGFEVPIGLQQIATSGLESLVTGALVWWIPNAA